MKNNRNLHLLKLLNDDNFDGCTYTFGSEPRTIIFNGHRFISYITPGDISTAYSNAEEFISYYERNEKYNDINFNYENIHELWD